MTIKFYDGIPIRFDKFGWKLRIKFWWYKYIRKLDIVGFYDGIPIIRTRYLNPPW